MEKMKSRDHLLFKLLPRPVAGTCNYKLRKNSEKFLLFNGSITGRTNRADSFLTRGYARAYHELLQELRYANESLTHS